MGDEGLEDVPTGGPHSPPPKPGAVLNADQMSPMEVTLNPHTGGETLNPICPECEQPILERVGAHERRFVCGCDELREFVFEVE